ncbi:uncharacterized protein N7459_002217 [Penicillium hispanicum]|uniref:uncharacterized protein n=1 Tax=Penicillium hispanicum TaxID=1080232 RepID=UPI0025414C8D|nr:uncharacterized protein N7459_002217 [Penicillium hispanicum]KAJ5591848.1 hypothetical protein N7459_002217 [Penicillium hispanicum]
MSHSQSLVGHRLLAKESLGYLPEQLGQPPQIIMSSWNSDLVAAPPMKTTLSSSDSSNEESRFGSLESIDGSLHAATSASLGLVHQTPVSSSGWDTKHSFISATEETPSTSSSFSFMDIPPDEPAVDYNPLFYTPTPGDHTLDKTISLPNDNQPFTHPSITDWTLSMRNNPESWQQSFNSENTANDPAWAAAEHLANGWSFPEAIPTTGLDIPAMSTYEPFDTIQAPSINHCYPLGPPSTPTTSESDPEHTTAITLAQHQLQAPTHHRYQAFTTNSLPSPSDTLLQPTAPPSHDAAINASLHYTDTRNAFLIECKQRGLSYRDIKRIGGFKEAESTLRGRFRTLTKAKDQRVRKPKWLDTDIKLLCEAVNIFSKGTAACALYALQPPKVSWKKVAQYICAHGGSYQFGNATCKKKWCEIHDIKL